MNRYLTDRSDVSSRDIDRYDGLENKSKRLIRQIVRAVLDIRDLKAMLICSDRRYR